MTYAGSEGTSRHKLEQLLFSSLDADFDLHATFHNVLSLLDMDSGNTTVNLVNALVTSPGLQFKDTFSNLMRDFYLADTMSLDFTSDSSHQFLNSWIANKTNDLIKDVVTPEKLPAPVLLLIINIAYFKGSWAYPFHIRDTKLRQFYLAPNVGKDMYMMHKKKLKLFYGDAPRLKSKILELPFEGSAISLYVVVPDDITGLPYLEGQLTAPGIWTDLTRMVFVDVELVLPRFKLDVEVHVRGALSKMGLRELLSPSLANLGGITGSAKLFLSGILQKTVFELTEEGVEVVTLMGQRIALSAMNTVYQVTVDHPFFYFILDKRTQMPFFMGRIVYPPEGSDSLGDLGFRLDEATSSASKLYILYLLYYTVLTMSLHLL